MTRTVVLIVVGLVILGVGVHYVRSHRTPSNAESLPGRVIGVVEKRSSIPGNPMRLYGPTVEYRDPRTGDQRKLPPASLQPRAYEVGETVTLARDPASGEIRLPLPRPRMQMALPFVMGLGAITLGVYDLSR